MGPFLSKKIDEQLPEDEKLSEDEQIYQILIENYQFTPNLIDVFFNNDIKKFKVKEFVDISLKHLLSNNYLSFLQSSLASDINGYIFIHILLKYKLISQQSYNEIKIYRQNFEKIQKKYDKLEILLQKIIIQNNNQAREKIIQQLAKANANLISCKIIGDQVLATVIDIESQFSSYRIVNEQFSSIIRNFKLTGTYRFTMNGEPHMVVLHVNGPPDRDAILKFSIFEKPIKIYNKPTFDNINSPIIIDNAVFGYNKNQYLWGSSNPLFSTKSWISWCQDQQPKFLTGEWYYIIINMKTVLDINTPEEFIEFTDKYSKNNKQKIDWRAVSDEYSGIAIMKHLNNFYDTWYNGWDVDSIVIWDPTSIINIQQLTLEEKKIFNKK